MEPVGPDRQTDPFSRPNDLRAYKLPFFLSIFVCYIVHRILVIQNSGVIYNSGVFFAKYFHGLHGFLVIQNSNVLLAELFHGRPLRP
ncbi:hypothetical protein H5410_042222 [Solanum commersonii]|uniref:Uncharacterized protein n=1 Tax=Solanum commersonii TaxID=4109 RepID=A0A9J5XWY6_SOLCO|nr:hypothetical protein H5410_042222 [Solanum commersonii]